MKRMIRAAIGVLTVLIIVPVSFAAPESEDSLATADLAELDRKLNNPLTKIWSLTFQNNTAIKDGDAIDGSEYSNTLFFQPFMPFEVGADKGTMLTFRPVFPLATQPTFNSSDSRNSSSHETGLGDVQLLTLVGPNRGGGLVWGAGGTFVFPTATDDALGKEKYQAGPAAMLFYIGKPWVGGAMVQHWNSVAGEDDRDDINRTEIQYTIRRSIPGAMSIGMGPTVSVDWEEDSDNQLTFPVGLGLTKTMRWGKIPVKVRGEVHYSVISPDDYGDEWNFRVQVTPVIQNPFR